MFVNARIETENLIIRPYRIEDAEALYSIVSEPDFFNFIPEAVPSLEDVRNIIQWSIECNRKNTKERIYKFNLGLILKESQELIGYAGLGPYDLDPCQVELYYGLGSKYRGRGLAKEAAFAVLGYGFQTLELQEVCTTVHPENIPSVKILEKLKMTFEKELTGLSREEAVFEGYHYFKVRNEAFSAK